jgi:hypothetical protein
VLEGVFVVVVVVAAANDDADHDEDNQLVLFASHEPSAKSGRAQKASGGGQIATPLQDRLQRRQPRRPWQAGWNLNFSVRQRELGGLVRRH